MRIGVCSLLLLAVLIGCGPAPKIAGRWAALVEGSTTPVEMEFSAGGDVTITLPSPDAKLARSGTYEATESQLKMTISQKIEDGKAEDIEPQLTKFELNWEGDDKVVLKPVSTDQFTFTQLWTLTRKDP